MVDADLSLLGPTPPEIFEIEDQFVHIVHMNQVYDINIGVLILVSEKELSQRALIQLSSFIESIIKMRKRSHALALIDQLTNILSASRKDIYNTIGTYVDKMICPSETILFVNEGSRLHKLRSIYSTKDSDVIVP